MKHVIVGLVVSGATLGACLLWAVLKTLVGPMWAVVIIGFSAVAGAIVGGIDYITERNAG